LLDRGKTWDEEMAIDYLSDQCHDLSGKTVLISAVKKWGVGRLLKLISSTLTQVTQFA